MSITAIVENDTIKLPVHVPDGTTVEILLPQANWPANFFDEIRIDDPAFERPPQGELPSAPKLTE